MVERADELFALAPGEFTAARDALAKKLRVDGDKEGAAAVKALKRPTVVAWAINHAARTRPDELADLLAAGGALRRAHEGLMSGVGDRDTLRTANDGERAAVSAFARVVRDEASAAGAPLAASALDKVRDTLHAATLNENVHAALKAGRLEREADAVGDAGMLAAWAPAKPAPKRAGRRAAGTEQLEIGDDAPTSAERPAGKAIGSGGRRTGRGKASDEGETEATARAGTEAAGGEAAPKRSSADRRAAAAAHETAVKRLREADREAKRAEREADAARRKVDRAERAVEKARADLADAEEELAAMQDEERDAQRDVREAKGTLAAAQEAVDEATERL